MFGNDNPQAQASNQDNNGFDPANFTQPVTTTMSSSAGAPNSTGIPADILDTPELPVTGTPDTMPGSDLTSSTVTDSSIDTGNELLNLKQQALHQLTPLVDQLDQTPEEKFRTTMMMIQASDDQSLLKTAYDAAQTISDEKERAQALLDVINEINYFTQHGQTQ